MKNSDIKNASDAYWWFYNHPKLEYDGHCPPWIELTPHLVNPVDNTIHSMAGLNTKLEWWIECGPYCASECGEYPDAQHDYNLDCGGDTADEAIINLAALVLEHYGDYDY